MEIYWNDLKNPNYITFCSFGNIRDLLCVQKGANLSKLSIRQ